MREQSHIDAMRDAIRGDLERARSRNPDIFENALPPTAPGAEPEPAVDAAPEPEPQSVLQAVPDPEPEPQPEPEAIAEPEPDPAPERGFFARLAFWR